MQWSCLWQRRKLSALAASGELLPQGSPHARHAAQCPECARDLEWYVAADRALALSLTAPQPSGDCADATWARLIAARRQRSYLWPAILASAATCAVAVLVLRAPSAPVVQTAVHPSLAASIPPARVTNSPAVRAHRAVAAVPSERRAIHRRRIRLARVSRGPHPAAAPTAESVTPPVSLTRLAYWYECRGDFRSAADAYGQAAQIHPTDSLLFDAGRTSECAGDTAQAVDYYARMLKCGATPNTQPRQDTDSERGTEPWNDTSV
jgi:hypothetical protein